MRRLLVAAALAAPFLVPGASAMACELSQCVPPWLRCVVVIPGACDECPPRCVP